MKTVTLAPTIKHSQQKPAYSIRSRILGSNYKSINIQELNRISDIVGTKKFRDTNNIFYIKFNPQKDRHIDKDNKISGRHKNKNTSITLKQPLMRYEEQKNIDTTLPEINQFQRSNIKNKQFKDKDQELNQDDKGNVGYTEVKNNSEGEVKFRDIDNYPDISLRTLYFYKKQSLNTQLQFFKAYNRHQKSKTYDRSQKFNTQLIGIQKTCYQKKINIGQTKRSTSFSVKQSQKNTGRKQNQPQQDHYRQKYIDKQQNSNIQTGLDPKIALLGSHFPTNRMYATNYSKGGNKLQYLKPKPEKSKRYRKQDGFEPWNVVEEHENQHQ